MIGVNVVGVKKAMDNIAKDIYKAKREMMVEIDRRLERVTPVLTGRARSNWLASVDEPVNSTIFNNVTANKRRIRRGKAPLRRPSTYNPRRVWPVNPSRRDMWKDLYLSNKLDYIEGLNNGTIPTTKAGRRFVNAAVRRGIRKLKRGLR